MGLRSYPSGSFVPETSAMSFSLIRSDKPVYADLTHWSLPTFYGNGRTYVSYLRNPYPHVSGGLHDFYGRLHAWVGRSHGGFPDFGCLDPYRPQAPYQLSGTQGGRLCPKALGSNAPGPPGYDRYGQFDSSFHISTNKVDPFPHLVTFDSRASPLVRGSGHNSPREASSLSERDSRPPISSESANIDRVVPPPRDRETYLQALRDTRSRHVCNSVELAPSLVHVSNSGATSPSGGCSVSGLAGEVNVHVSSIQSAQQSHSEAPVHPGGRSNSHSPLVAETVVVSTPTSSFGDHPLCFPYHLDLLSQQDQKYASNGKSYHLHAWRLSCDTIKQQAFQTRSLGLPQPLGGPQPIACTTISDFALLVGPQGKGLIRLTPQLLR